MRLLVIEDDPQLLRSLAAILREENYAVDVASDGEDGLFKAQNGEYDAIVLDIMLPLLNGWEVLAGLRSSRKTPVLLLTARDTVPDRHRRIASPFAVSDSTVCRASTFCSGDWKIDFGYACEKGDL